MNSRKLKVSYCSRSIKSQRATKFLPKVVIEGDWFHAAGFSIGDSVSVIVQHGQITLIREPDPIALPVAA